MCRHIPMSIHLFAVALFATSTLASPIVVPSDLNPGDTYRLAFVTSTTRIATSTDIADYNAFVTSVVAGQPELAALGTTWTAIASTATVDARDNTSTNPAVSTGVPIYRLDDTRIADDNFDLWDGDIDASLSTTETGILISTYVWTGTFHSGDAFAPLGGSGPAIGSSSLAILGHWVFTGLGNNLGSNNLYAISGPLTVVPEPSAVFLGCIGATASAVCMIRRRATFRRL